LLIKIDGAAMVSIVEVDVLKKLISEYVVGAVDGEDGLSLQVGDPHR
jgi:hypothetical protein